MTDDIRALKVLSRENEVIWLKNFVNFQESYMAVKHATDDINKTQVIQKNSI